jgi:hypothetical protein
MSEHYIKVYARIHSNDAIVSKNNQPNASKFEKAFPLTRNKSFFDEVKQKTKNQKSSIQVYDDTSIILHKEALAAKNNSKQQAFIVDKVFESNCTDTDIFSNISNLIDYTVNGLNSTIFSFGVPASGKTTTLYGIVPSAINLLFEKIDIFSNTKHNRKNFFVEMGYVELYNNQFRNLLYNLNNNDSSTENSDDLVSTNCSIKQNSQQQQKGQNKIEKIDVHESASLGVFLSSISNIRMQVTEPKEAINFFIKASNNRITRQTNLNNNSSRLLFY